MKAYIKNMWLFQGLMTLALTAHAAEISGPQPDRQMLAICQCIDPNNANKDANCRQLTATVTNEQTAAAARGGMMMPGMMQGMMPGMNHNGGSQGPVPAPAGGQVVR